MRRLGSFPRPFIEPWSRSAITRIATHPLSVHLEIFITQGVRSHSRLDPNQPSQSLLTIRRSRRRSRQQCAACCRAPPRLALLMVEAGLGGGRSATGCRRMDDCRHGAVAECTEFAGLYPERTRCINLPIYLKQIESFSQFVVISVLPVLLELIANVLDTRLVTRCSSWLATSLVPQPVRSAIRRNNFRQRQSSGQCSRRICFIFSANCSPG
jgi:hypothetical protein